MAIGVASEEMKVDRDIVRAAVRNDWRSFLYADPEMMADRDISYRYKLQECIKSHNSEYDNCLLSHLPKYSDPSASVSRADIQNEFPLARRPFA